MSGGGRLDICCIPTNNLLRIRYSKNALCRQCLRVTNEARRTCTQSSIQNLQVNVCRIVKIHTIHICRDGHEHSRRSGLRGWSRFGRRTRERRRVREEILAVTSANPAIAEMVDFR